MRMEEEKVYLCIFSYSLNTHYSLLDSLGKEFAHLSSLNICAYKFLIKKTLCKNEFLISYFLRLEGCQHWLDSSHIETLKLDGCLS